MTLTYLFRQEGAGYSIEGLFKQLAAYFRRRTNVDSVNEVYVPHMTLTPYTLRANLWLAYRQKADVYHITGDVHYLMLVLPPSKTVLTIHDCISLDRQLQAGNRFKFRLIWLLFYYLPMLRAVYITTVSEKSKQELAHLVGPSLAQKVRVVPNHYNPAIQPAPNVFNDSKPVILHIGIGEHKNLNRLVDALTDIKCRLVVISPLPTEKRQYIERSGIDCEIREKLSEEEVLSAYRQCDIVALPSTYEGFGMPVLEANAMGRPVVTSAISPLREIAGNAACLVDPYSVESIREGMLRVITDAAYRDGLIEVGYKNAAKYTIEQVAAQYEALYRQITG